MYPDSLSRIVVGMPLGRYRRVFITSLNLVCSFFVFFFANVLAFTCICHYCYDDGVDHLPHCLQFYPSELFITRFRDNSGSGPVLSSFLFPLCGLISCLCCLISLLGIYMLGLLLILPRLVSGSLSFLFLFLLLCILLLRIVCGNCWPHG